MQQIYRTAPMPKCDFIKTAKQNTFFRTPFQNTNSEHLFLKTTLGGCFCTIYFGSLLSLLSFMRPRASKVYNINDKIDIKLLTRLRLCF